MRYRRCRLPTPTKLRRCHHHHHRHRIQLDAGTAVDGGTGRRRDADGGKGRGPYSRRAVVTALMYAAQQADVRTVHRILKIKPSLVYHRDRLGRTALHYCAGGGGAGGRAAQSADLLVMAAPELVENQDQDGFTPLHLAVIAGNMQLVTFLLANGADVAAKDNEEHSVVHWAAVCGETAALRAILAAGAPVSTPDVHGGYPLHYAAQMCGGVSTTNSETYPVTRIIEYGVPQGTVLGPFNIYISTGKITAFADDTVIFYKSTSWNVLKNAIADDFPNIINWFYYKLFTINFQKTYFVPFTCYKHTQISGYIYTYRPTLKMEQTYRLNTSKIRTMIGRFKIYKQLFDIKYLKMLNSALIESHLKYGILATNNYLKKLTIVQKWLLKIILYIFNRKTI